MKNQFQFVICGTDTDIGKTLISSFFVRGLNSFYWKPIQSGIESETDSQAIERLTKVEKTKIIRDWFIKLKSGGYLIISYPTKNSFPEWKQTCEETNIEYSGLTFPLSEDIIKSFKSDEIFFSKKYLYIENFPDIYKLFRSIVNVGAQSSKCQRKKVHELRKIQRYWPKKETNSVNLTWEINIQILKKS